MLRHRTWLLWHLLLFFPLVPLVAVHAQEAGVLPGPTIRVSTRLVLVDVVVFDKQNRPVPDLAAADFTISEKGKAQKIAFFTGPAEPGKPSVPALAPGVFSNRPEFRSPSGPPTVILLDAVNTPVTDQIYARKQMLKFLVDQYKPGSPTAVFTLGERLTLLQDFSDDPQILLATLRNYVANRPVESREPAPPDMPALPIAGSREREILLASQLSSFTEGEVRYVMDRRCDVTLAAMRSLARILGGIPGRKNVIWLNTGFPFHLFPELSNGMQSSGSQWSDLQLAATGPGRGVFDSNQQRFYFNQIRDASAQFASSQIAIYPVDVTGLSPRIRGRVDEQMTMQEFADETGGQAFLNQNDIPKGVELAYEDSAASYTIAYYPENKNWDGNYRTISVKVNRPQTQVRYRRGYFAVDPLKVDEKTFDSSLAEAVQAKVPATQIVFDANLSPIEKGKTRVEFMLDASALSAEDADQGKRLNAVFQVIVFGEDGKATDNRAMKLDRILPPATYQKIAQLGLSVHLDIDTPVKKSLACLVVRDNRTGFIGTVQASLGQ